MNTRMVAMVGVLLSGCPMQASPDAGSDAGGGGGTTTGSCGQVPNYAVQAYGVVGESLTLSLDSSSPDPTGAVCTPTAIVRSPAGEEHLVPVTFFQFWRGYLRTVFSVTPSMAGEWTVILTWSGPGRSDEQVVKFPVYEITQLGPSITQNFVDRMDDCVGGLHRTSGGLVVCAREDGLTWVYSSAGSVITSFTGFGARVLGNEVWTLIGTDTVEHRTDVDGGLRFDGATAIKFGGRLSEVEPGRYVRSTPDGVMEARWDGSTLTSLITSSVPPAEFVEATGVAWTVAGCSVRQGCQQTTCPPIVICPNENHPRTTLVSADALWGVENSGPRFRMIKRPLTSVSTPAEGVFVDFIAPGSGTLAFDGEPPGAPFFDTGRHVILARRAGDEIAVAVAARSGRVLAVTREWLITTQGDDAQTLVFLPMP